MDYSKIIIEFDEWRKSKDESVEKSFNPTLENAYLSGIIDDNTIEKAWKKSAVGTVVTHKDGTKYKKVSETGDAKKDWQIVKKDKGTSTEEAKKVFSPKELTDYAKQASETNLQAIIKNSGDAKLREAAHNELERRLAEEHPQEKDDKGKEKPAEKKQPEKKEEKVDPIKKLESEYEGKSVEELVKLKKKQYPNPDIESKMSPEEKLLNKVIAKKFSDLNEAIKQKRKDKEVKKAEENELPDRFKAGTECMRVIPKKEEENEVKKGYEQWL